ncbi:MAG: pentapeptide repeat-containing protein [Okeania sp. SIO3B5]|uniref:pentapeptide repeat-containing protein n=1 Tax=Okeania sp. SIO3B5 TaxID=2607811 RepID=UPI00140176B9|nr:pentapeptide repeat-containing protein [Okeania sp. SIO3B5]NEO54405.1 pentapeptide repeat-containing protein [Okeania sp. SIO3B5]
MSKISEITIEELLELYAAGQRDFTRYTIKHTDQYFENGIDLRGVKFRGDSLEAIFFSLENSNLSRADLRGINFRKANLDCCNLSETLLNKASLWCADLNRANLSGANLSGASLSGTTFITANLKGANLSKTKLYETSFNCADLSGVNFSDAKINGPVWFNEANLTQVDFTKVILDIGWDEISFKEAYFENTIMPDGSIRNS